MYQILVVDDERIERNGIKMLLRHMQLLCEITEAANGRDALEYLKGHTADVLLTDVKMPFMDGIQLIEECKKENINEDMKCIIFSGCSEFDYARKAVRLGVSDYILKPVDPSEFKETITRVIQELEAERAEKNMKKKGTKIIVNFLIRGIIGFAIIFFVNEFLDGQGISACVGMNPITFLTSGSFGFPGVALLYGITFYQIM